MGRPTTQVSSDGAECKKPTLRVEEAAGILGISARSAYRACARGELPSIRIGRRLVVPREPLELLLKGRPGRARSGRTVDKPTSSLQ